MNWQNDLPTMGTIDARTFQTQLNDLATTIAYKVQREAEKLGLKPAYVSADIYYILRQAQQTYNLFFFLNADDRRKNDTDWRVAYSAVTLPLIRTMIDCLYNITSILQDPIANGYLFRSSGYRLALEALDNDQVRYGADPKWDNWIREQRDFLCFDIRRNGLDEATIRNEKRLWPTLSGYLRIKNPSIVAHQDFLRSLTLGFWQEYSGISHATFQGLLPIGVLMAPKDLPIEFRPKVEDVSESLIALLLFRVAAVLLCIVTEIQASLKFDGARINERLHEIWNALQPAREVRELFDQRYEGLMKKAGLNP
jgi:hypothetical protein